MKKIKWKNDVTPVLREGKYYLYDYIGSIPPSELWKVTEKINDKTYNISTDNGSYTFMLWDETKEVLYELTDNEAALYNVIGCPNILDMEKNV